MKIEFILNKIFPFSSLLAINQQMCDIHSVKTVKFRIGPDCVLKDVPVEITQFQPCIGRKNQLIENELCAPKVI